MSRAAATSAQRERRAAHVERADESRQQQRRDRFIRMERLSLPEASHLPSRFDPGAAYDERGARA